MNFTAEYQATFEEFREASLVIQKRFRRRVFRRAMIVRIVFGWLVTMSVAAMMFVFLLQNSSVSRSAFWPWFLGFAAFFPIVMLVQHRMRRRNLSKMWDAAPVWHQKRSISIDDYGLTIALRTCTYRTVWPHYMRFEETPTLFLLFVSEHSAEFIPKRVFENSSDVEVLRDLLQCSISSATQAFPVIPIAEK